VYDLHDLGEFKSRSPDTAATKYGTRDELKAAVTSLASAGVDVVVDAVLNHRTNADEVQIVRATPYSNDNRKLALDGGAAYEIAAYCKFNYSARGDKYSRYKWDAGSFDSVDYDGRQPDRRGVVFLFEGKAFDDFVSLERGNYAHLLGCDVDFNSKYVRKELTEWGEWMIEPSTIGGCQGMRLDGLKHIPTWFWPDWIRAMRARAEKQSGGKEFFVVGEYVQYDVGTLRWYLDATEHLMRLFDFPLLNKFHAYSNDGNGSDMRKIFDETLVRDRPESAVTFVANHDTVPSQSLERHVQDWFKPLAYALILLRKDGHPCVFLADIDGSEYVGERGPVKLTSFKKTLYAMMRARQEATFGELREYFDDFHVVGWTFDGRLSPGGPPAAKALAVIMSAGPGGSKRMDVGSSGIAFRDVLGNDSGTVVSGPDGTAVFPCAGGSVSVFVQV
jgi:alpha-amylase